MADEKISQFTDGGLVQAGDYAGGVRAGANVKVTFGTAAAADIGDDVGEVVAFEDDGSGNPVIISPVFVTPVLGVAAATSLNKFTFTAPATAATINTRADNLTHSLPKESGNIALEILVQNSKSADYTTVLGDAGGEILHPSSDNNPRTFTIDGSVAYPVNSAITFINRINTLSIAITTDTMYLVGTATTGTRTLAANGIATAIKSESGVWIISGGGLT